MTTVIAVALGVAVLLAALGVGVVIGSAREAHALPSARPVAHRMTRADIDAWAELSGEEVLFADGFDGAIVGIAQRYNRWFVVYDQARVIQILMDRDDLEGDEAEEFYVANVVGAWMGEGTPAFLLTDRGLWW